MPVSKSSEPNTIHTLVTDSLTTALFQLMEKKAFSAISVSELCARAGVSRISFYRNFSSMEDIVVRYLNRCSDEKWPLIRDLPDEEQRRVFWNWLLSVYSEHKKEMELILSNNLSHLIKNHVFDCCGPKTGQPEKEAYARAILAGAIYGYIDEWIRRGMKEAPEDLRISKILEEIRG